MNEQTNNKKYFLGYEVSEYGQKNGYVDYRTLAKTFDSVLCNDITKLFYGTINNDYVEPEQVNGYIDNSDEIEQLQEQLDEITEQYENAEPDSDDAKRLSAQMDELQEQIDDLEREQDEQPEIYQYYIISSHGARILQDYTGEIVYYIEPLDIYVWGVTHWGTSWDYVLTDIKIDW
jgi:hypothetical protein